VHQPKLGLIGRHQAKVAIELMARGKAQKRRRHAAPSTENETESPLGWLKSRKDRNGHPLISDPQYEAG
jgi:hypothetical protein